MFLNKKKKNRKDISIIIDKKLNKYQKSDNNKINQNVIILLMNIKYEKTFFYS